MTDPVFGELRYNGSEWIGSVRTSSLGDEVLVAVAATDGPNPKPNPPSEAQRLAFTSFLKHEVGVMALVRVELLSYHLLMWRLTSKGQGDADTLGNEAVPPPERTEEVLAGFGTAQIFVPRQHDPLGDSSGMWICLIYDDLWRPGVRLDVEVNDNKEAGVRAYH